MRFMVMVKSTPDMEAGAMPSEELLRQMGDFNEEMVKAGVMLAGDGLQASSKGARVTFSNRKPTVVDGPFTEAKELVAGYWIIQARSKEEAVQWARRVPFVDGEIEVRQLFELSDFPAGDAIDLHKDLQQKLSKQ